MILECSELETTCVIVNEHPGTCVMWLQGQKRRTESWCSPAMISAARSGQNNMAKHGNVKKYRIHPNTWFTWSRALNAIEWQQIALWKSSGPLPGQSAQAHQLRKIVLCIKIWQGTRIIARMAPVAICRKLNGTPVKRVLCEVHRKWR